MLRFFQWFGAPAPRRWWDPVYETVSIFRHLSQASCVVLNWLETMKHQSKSRPKSKKSKPLHEPRPDAAGVDIGQPKSGRPSDRIVTRSRSEDSAPSPKTS